MTQTYCSAQAAADYLNVKVSTIYAYVSRGLIRSEETSGVKRNRRYRWDDVKQLKQRTQLRKHPEEATKLSLFWGQPILESEITRLTDDDMFYRGQPLTSLIQTDFETVLNILWLDTGNEKMSWPTLPKNLKILLKPFKKLDMLSQLQAIIPLLMQDNPSAFLTDKISVIKIGQQLMITLAAIMTGQYIHFSQIARHLSGHFGIRIQLINALLILCADHELNTSTFTARCVASTQASPYAAINAGLSALSGSKHGGMIAEIMRMFSQAKHHKPANIIKHYAQTQNQIPGFSHPLYPKGDPRAKILLELFPTSKQPKYLSKVKEFIQSKTNQNPSIDYAIAAICATHRLSADMGLALFGLSRIAGFVAHINEQYQLNKLIRPRMHYIGK